MIKPILANIYYFIFLLIWVGSAAVFGLLIVLMFLGIRSIEIATLFVIYYSAKYFYPPKQIRIFTVLSAKLRTHYFRNTRTIIEDQEILKKVIIAFAPHGVLCCAWVMNLIVSEHFLDKGYRFLIAGVLMKVPIVSDVMQYFGAGSVEKESMLALMKKGNNIAFIPGGFEEATLMEYGKHKLFLKDRKGFIKYSLQYGYKLVPSYTFGEEKTYYTFTGFQKFRLFLNKLKLPGVIFISKYLLLPNKDVDLITVYGKVINLPQIDSPTEKDVEQWHQIYLEKQKELFYKHLPSYTEEKLELHIY